MASPLRSPLSSPGLSPSYRHVRSRLRQSPVEIKERMRKSYKERIQNSRNVFFNSMRNVGSESDLRNTLSRVLSDLFRNEQLEPDDQEYQLLEAIREELVHDEMNWLQEEYERANLDNIDWATMEPTDDVICPTCQKVNLLQKNNRITCTHCNWSVKTDKTLPQLKTDIISAMNHHSKTCTGHVEFLPAAEYDDVHVLLICNTCSEMRIIL